MSKINLLATIALAFISNPKENVLHVTDDGNCFTEKGKGHGIRHAKVNKLTLKEVKRADYEKDIAEQLAETKKSLKDSEAKAAEAAAVEETAAEEGKKKAIKK